MTQDSGLRTNYARDREYWNNYYSGTNDIISRPSSFAESILCELDKNGHILDIGCGNRRDSLYFLANGLKVTGIDASDIAIEKLRGITSVMNRRNLSAGISSETQRFTRKDTITLTPGSHFTQ